MVNASTKSRSAKRVWSGPQAFRHTSATARAGRHLTAIAVFLSGAFFFLELTIGPIWAIPMDIAPAFSGTASGLMNSGSALAAIVSPLAFGMIIDRTGNWTLPFVGSIALLGFGAVLSFFMRPEKTLTVPPPAGKLVPPLTADT